MKISFSACKQPQPLLNFPRGILNIDPFMSWHRKDKVVIVIGATGTGKSRLSIDLATRFSAEIINSDKMQVYEGLDIVTNKITQEERRGVPHHLLGVVDSNADDFTAVDFRHHVARTVEFIVRRDRLPIIAGGSNSFIKSLVDDEFQSRYECCFLWIDVSLPVLHSFVSKRVNKMVRAGLVDEVRQLFNPKSDYTRGLRRAIGVPELDQFLSAEVANEDDKIRARLLEIAIHKIKNNTCKLASRQLKNILRLQNQMGWKFHRLDATEAFRKCGAESDEAWDRHVARPSAKIVDKFLYKQDSAPSSHFIIKKILPQLLPLWSKPHR